MLADSHCHLDLLDLTPFGGEVAAVLAEAKANDVSRFLCVCVTLADFPKIIEITEQYPEVYASFGIHPNELMTDELSIVQLIQYASHPKVVAIGETGLDYYRSEGDLSWQHTRFRNHIAAAKTTKKPLIIHTRQARADTIRILQEEQANAVGGVMHCFTEDMTTAQQALDLGFYISFSGIVTFKNATELQAVAQYVPLDRLLVETDSPYLAPMPHRGKPNVPGYVRHVAEFIAQLRGISYQQVADSTTQNFLRLFKIKD
jgi:TatD DNase family protein